jgi:hypothetical protein
VKRTARARAALTALATLTATACIGARIDSPAPVDQRAAGTWTTLAPMPTPRQEVAVAVLDGRIWVIVVDEAFTP